MGITVKDYSDYYLVKLMDDYTTVNKSSRPLTRKQVRKGELDLTELLIEAGNMLKARARAVSAALDYLNGGN